jgi:hypothetical protein
LRVERRVLLYRRRGQRKHTGMAHGCDKAGHEDVEDEREEGGMCGLKCGAGREMDARMEIV